MTPHPSPPVARVDAPSAPVPYHQLPRSLPHRSCWWRPIVAIMVAAAVYAVMLTQLMVPLLVLGAFWPAAGVSATFTDPLNPADQLGSFGSLALLVPAVLIGSLAGYGRAGIVWSVARRIRWGLLGRAATVVVPVYLLVNVGLNLVLEREALAVPPLTGRVLLAWAITMSLVALQCAGEELVFRALPLQALGTWVRRPQPALWLGVLLPVPLFVLGHGYDWKGQIDIALFAIVMGLLAWKTGGLEIPLLLHTANNATLFAIAPLIPGFTEQGEVSWLGLALALLPMLGLAAGTWWWHSRREGLGLWEPSLR